MNSNARRSKRLIAGFLAAVLALTVAPIIGFASPAGAALTVAEPTGEGSFCENVGNQEPFSDVQASDPARDEIICLIATQITTGVTVTTYEPNSSVTRRQMALFLTRLAAEADRLEIDDNIDELPEPEAGDAFSDLDGESQAVKAAISQIEQAEIAGGFTDGTYRPEAQVSRRQMAAFIDRLYEYLTGAALPRAAVDNFADDNDDSAQAQSSTNAVAEVGIFVGNEDGTFEPAQEITRRQMANVLTRTLQVLFENGEIDQWSDDDETPPTSNQTFVVTPTDTQTRVLVEDETAGTQPERDADNRAFSATGLTNGTTYRITLVNANSVTIDENGQVTFLASADGASTTGFSADTGVDVADIVAVNNAAQNANTNTVTTQPVNGSITVTIDGTGLGSVIPVLYVNGGPGGTATTGGTSPRLEVQATAAGQRSAPTESFGIGGVTTFVAAAAQNGVIGTSTVASVNKAADTFVANQGAAPAGADDNPPAVAGTLRTFTYEANDLFTVNGVSVGLAAFEAALSSGDGISGTYTTDPAGVSSFVLADTNPGTGPTATATNGGVGPNSNDITVTANFATTEVDQVVVQRAPVVSGTVGTFATIATVLATDVDANAAGTQIRYVDNDVAVGSYQYRVAGVNDGQQGTSGTPSATVQSAAPTGDVTAPQFVASTLITDSGFAGVLDAGDAFTLRFDEAMAAPAAGASLRIQDTQSIVNLSPTIVDVICGTNATCTLNAAAIPAAPDGPNAGAAANTILTVTVTGAPTSVQAGSTPGAQFPATITNTSGITDAAGNRVELTQGNRAFGPVGQ